MTMTMIHVTMNTHFSCLWSSISTLDIFLLRIPTKEAKVVGGDGGLRCPRHPYRYRQRVLVAHSSARVHLRII
jgi:hypothetical protein